jgi:hypothetical protein
MTMTPLPATQALDAYFLEARARLLDLAAILDRIGRGTEPAAALADPRSEKLRRALEILLTRTDGRAEAIQQLFSLDYDPAWTRPKPR